MKYSNAFVVLGAVGLCALAACANDSGDDAASSESDDALTLSSPVMFHGVAIESFDTTMPDVDTLGFDLKFDLDAATAGDESYVAEAKGYFVATRKLSELELDFAAATNGTAAAKANVIKSVELVRLNGSAAESIPVANVQINEANQKIKIPFASAIGRGKAFTLRIAYEGKPLQADGVDPNDFTAYGGFMARQKNSAGKRIFLSLDWPNKAHWWLPLRDHPRDGFLTFMDVGTNANMTVLGNGDKTTTTEGGKTRNQFLSRTAMPSYDLHLAMYDAWLSESFPHSSAPGTTTADTIPMTFWVYDANSETLGDADNDPSTPDTVVKSVPTRDFARQEYSLERDAMNFYIDAFGPFRWSGVDFVEEPIFGGGMEHAGVVSMDETRFEGSEDGKTRYTAYHELAHHWSGNLARIKTWNDFWMSEGFAEYFTVRFALSKNDPSYLHTMYRNAWRSESRRRILGPSAPAASLLHPVAPRSDFPGLSKSASGEVDVLSIFDALVYNKGAMVLVMLDQRLGTQAFSAFLSDWFTSRAGKAVSTEDFQRALTRRFADKKDELDRFFDEFVYGTYRPEVRVTTSPGTKGKTKVVVEQLQQGVGPDDGYHFPLDLDLVDTAGAKHRVTIDVGSRKVTKTVSVADVASVVVNPDERMLVATTCDDTHACPAKYSCVSGSSSLAVQPPTPDGGTAPPVTDPLKLCRPD